NLSGFAQAAGCECAAQTAYVRETAAYIKRERPFLAEGLERLGFTLFPGNANFLLLYSEDALYAPLLERGILIRDCGNFRGLSEGFYRIAVKRREENMALLKEIGEIR
ncbi:MAG: aminotransferase class I/II-fold pyridoxal phosphate-dependent enzyme, partial [Lachnospiraceae bacterium]|nr:aminotransferase class I/II-fold pyridoxal phosphate-dependent enzyme [Lachnospiraceae bacterium]